MRVDQWLPAAHRGDAIGDEAIRIRDVLRRAGHASQIFALDIDEEAAADVLPFSERSASDAVILHFALPSPLTPAFAESSAKRVLIYHNITPAEFFSGTNSSGLVNGLGKNPLPSPARASTGLVTQGPDPVEIVHRPLVKMPSGATVLRAWR